MYKFCNHDNVALIRPIWQRECALGTNIVGIGQWRHFGHSRCPSDRFQPSDECDPKKERRPSWRKQSCSNKWCPTTIPIDDDDDDVVGATEKYLATSAISAWRFGHQKAHLYDHFHAVRCRQIVDSGSNSAGDIDAYAATSPESCTSRSARQTARFRQGFQALFIVDQNDNIDDHDDVNETCADQKRTPCRWYCCHRSGQRKWQCSSAGQQHLDVGQL